MAEGKRPFILYTDLIHTVEKMPRDLRGDLFLHILKYVNDQDPETDDLILEIAFEPIKQSLKRDLVKYRKICERNRNNGALGGRPPNNPKKPKKPTGLSGNPKNPDEPDNDIYDIYDNDIKGITVVSDDFKKNDELMRQIVNNQSEHQTWIEQVYMKFRLSNKKLGFLLEEFNKNLVLTDEVKPNLKEYKKHFFNWMNVQESKGNLAHLKK